MSLIDMTSLSARSTTTLSIKKQSKQINKMINKNIYNVNLSSPTCETLIKRLLLHVNASNALCTIPIFQTTCDRRGHNVVRIHTTATNQKRLFHFVKVFLKKKKTLLKPRCTSNLGGWAISRCFSWIWWRQTRGAWESDPAATCPNNSLICANAKCKEL